MSAASPIVLGITGASGAVYARRLLNVLIHSGYDVDLSISESGRAVWLQELDVALDLQKFDPYSILAKTTPTADKRLAATIELNQPQTTGKLRYFHYKDFLAPIASGSALSRGMVICPCSGGTLSGVVHGASDTLIERAADVHLKERRKLILVPRETPLSLVYLDNLRRAAEAGAVVLPAMPGWYHGVQTLDDLIDFIVARILDQLEVPHALMRRWGSDDSAN
ncbi:UbiX family flavin prenyltransferase [Blastopirellula sp. JC732]|uniref:Flavin prenyltransferase UbiX n=1 Tax=Blastopirellula sediminis TaxID=2894196 RepID=A0A9X1SMK4_9BACT|nr:flavin prenyltransferase UbiX [Blastopirellula sediminis]MCC9604916.1 UbiX family flavin prenyltransferase [Blastopirellula sediminis]MCC9631784.1 UbiX family flavin prenyltransferase [Blastopirellula sediminis]